MVWAPIHTAGNLTVRCSALLDSAPAAAGENNHRGAGGVIDCERKKKFTFDVDLLFDQHSFNRKLSNFHRQHPCGVATNTPPFSSDHPPSHPPPPPAPSPNLQNHL